MDANFWHQRWESNRIGFHQSEVNPLLIAHFKELSLAQGSRVFVPLCGKTLDIGWLLANGYQVTGAELSELAVQQLFAELGIEPEIVDMGKIKHYHASAIDIFVGDIFDLTRGILGAVDAVFDRAALVALPETMRVRYAQHLLEITDNAPQLLITYEYDQKLREGPPFSVSSEEVDRYYKTRYAVSRLASLDLGAGTENVWSLKPLTA